MPLTPNTKLGQYEVVESIGAGGMGEVYRARDTKLGRDVAIKVLPDEFARDKERLDRFEREARLLAQLNHANIATLHGLEEHDGQQFLVMELVEGETLAERIARGPLPGDEAIPLFIQIAEGLEAAHEKGIIHRDLKPANIKIGPDGKPKILDFGLAKAFGPNDEVPGETSQALTLTKGTALGAIMGTPSYMSPEQARGKSVDKKADIWSFGCCLYESLAHRTAFVGETVADTAARILEQEPDWEALPVNTPPKLESLLRWCLRKDTTRRLHDIADARIELQEVLGNPEIAAPRAASRDGLRWARVLPWTLASLAAVAAGLMGWTSWDLSQTRPEPVRRFAITLPSDEPLDPGLFWSSIAIAPDGSGVVYVAQSDNGNRLFYRDFATLEYSPVPGTEGGQHPFFAPDGEWVGFVEGGELRKVSLRTGEVFTLCDATSLWGADWGPEGDIVLVPGAAMGIWRVSADGGERELVVAPDFDSGERSFRFPQFLPDGETIVFTVISSGDRSGDDVRIDVLPLDGDGRRTLIQGGTHPLYAPTGHLLYARSSTILAAPFEPHRLEVVGNSRPVLEDVLVSSHSGAAHLSIASDGSLVYARGGAAPVEDRLVLVSRDGEVENLSMPRADYALARFGGSDRLLVVRRLGGNLDLWAYELSREGAVRLTFDTAIDTSPVATPDGERVMFASNRAGTMDLYSIPVDGSGVAELVRRSEHPAYPIAWSPDGEALIVLVLHPETLDDIWILTFDDEQEMVPFAVSPYLERQPAFSPDGRWIAYSSNETGTFEVYVQAFRPPGRKTRVSNAGGMEPVWSADGQELYYVDGNEVMVVDVTTESSFSASAPRELLAADWERSRIVWLHSFDVSDDAEKFLMIKEFAVSSTANEFVVALNWYEELNRLVPTN